MQTNHYKSGNRINHVTKPNKTAKTAGWGVRQVTVMQGLFSRPSLFWTILEIPLTQNTLCLLPKCNTRKLLFSKILDKYVSPQERNTDYE